MRRSSGARASEARCPFVDRRARPSILRRPGSASDESVEGYELVWRSVTKQTSNARAERWRMLAPASPLHAQRKGGGKRRRRRLGGILDVPIDAASMRRHMRRFNRKSVHGRASADTASATCFSSMRTWTLQGILGSATHLIESADLHFDVEHARPQFD